MSARTIDKVLASVFYRNIEDENSAGRNALRVKSHKGVFTGEFDAKLWEIIEAHLVANARAPSYAYLQAKLEKAQDFKLLERLKDVEDLPVFPYTDFHLLLEMLFEEHNRQQLGNVLIQATQINEGELKVGNEVLSGTEAACKFLLSKSADLAYRNTRGERLRGDIRLETDIAKENYLRTEQDPGDSVGILTGFDTIDRQTKGIKKGEMWILGGYSSHGKTTAALNIVHSALVRGYNSFYVSMEMSRDQIREILYCIHSGHPKFEGIHKPLRIDDIRYGLLTKEAKAFYFDVVLEDFKSCPDYGRIHIIQQTSDITPRVLQAEAELVHLQEFEVDLIVPDYAGLMKSDHFASDDRTKLNQILRDLKQIALGFSQGQKVAVLTPFQCNREGFKNASENNGVYKDLRSLSDANEADRSSDIVLAVFADHAMKARNEAVMTMLKGRDTGCADPFTLYANFASRLVKDVNIGVGNVESELLADLDRYVGGASYG